MNSEWISCAQENMIKWHTIIQSLYHFALKESGWMDFRVAGPVRPIVGLLCVVLSNETSEEHPIEFKRAHSHEYCYYIF